MGAKFSRGWTLTKESWALLRSDPSLTAFPVISALDKTLGTFDQASLAGAFKTK